MLFICVIYSDFHSRVQCATPNISFLRYLDLNAITVIGEDAFSGLTNLVKL